MARDLKDIQFEESLWYTNMHSLDTLQECHSNLMHIQEVKDKAQASLIEMKPTAPTYRETMERFQLFDRTHRTWYSQCSAKFPLDFRPVYPSQLTSGVRPVYK